MCIRDRVLRGKVKASKDRKLTTGSLATPCCWTSVEPPSSLLQASFEPPTCHLQTLLFATFGLQPQKYQMLLYLTGIGKFELVCFCSLIENKCCFTKQVLFVNELSSYSGLLSCYLRKVLFHSRHFQIFGFCNFTRIFIDNLYRSKHKSFDCF